MQQIKAVLRGQDGVELIEVDPNATITLWQADGSSVPGIVIPSSLLTSVKSFILGKAQPLRMLIWILKVNWSGTNSESCTIEAHSLDGTQTDESGNTVAVYRRIA